MKELSPRQLFVIVIALLSLSGCTGLTQISQGIAEKAPFAKPPILVKVGAHLWEGDPEYYNRGGAFEFVIKHGLANEIMIKENGADLVRVSSPPAAGSSANSVFSLVQDVSNDTNAQTTVQRYRIYTKESIASGPFVAPPDGTVRTYSFVERSINPGATGKDLISDPADQKITIWGRMPVIAVFTTSPANPRPMFP